MNRTLTMFLAAAAVVGATGGTLAATALGGDDDPEGRDTAAASDSADPTGSAGTSDPTGSDTPTSGGGEQPDGDPAAPGPGEPGDVLWVSQRALHDGDQEIPIQLVDRPASVERASGADAWVITTRSSPQEPSYEASVVRADGSVVVLDATFGDGDVSPDGTRYVAMRDDGSGYGVWDVATGELVDTVAQGETPDQYPFGGAQFVDDDTVASTWTDDRSRTVVLAGDLGSDERTLVSDDLAGQWSISPDGKWFAGTSRTAKDAETGFDACATVVPFGRPDADAGLTDCGSKFYGVPSFTLDSSSVLALPYESDGFGPGVFRPLPTGRAQVEQVDAPDATLDGVYLRDDLVLMLGAKNYDGDGTVITVCDSDGCEEVGRYDDAAEIAVLGTQT